MTNVLEVEQWYADVTCNNGTKFTVGPATSRAAADDLGKGGLLACSVSGFAESFALSGRTLSGAQLRSNLQSHLEASSAPTNINDLWPEDSSAVQGESDQVAVLGFSTSIVDGQHLSTVSCGDGTQFTIGPAPTLEDAVSNGVFGLLVCDNRSLLSGVTLSGEFTRALLNSTVAAALAALPTPLELDDLEMASPIAPEDGVTGQSGAYSVRQAASKWSWSASCTGSDGTSQLSGSGTSTTSSGAGEAAVDWVSRAACSAGGGNARAFEE
ncbi:MAG: hypothetical protein F4052_07840 [Dehalococcoidia bacterium]|nr:hypothetical protein [Dehalococcoidia bacterium]